MATELTIEYLRPVAKVAGGNVLGRMMLCFDAAIWIRRNMLEIANYITDLKVLSLHKLVLTLYWT